MSKLIKLSEIKDKDVKYMVENFNKISWPADHWDKQGISSKIANEIIKQVSNRVSKINLTNLSFDELFSKIQDLLLTENNLLDLKGINCSKYSGRKQKNSYYSFAEGENSPLFSGLLHKVDTSKYSTIENLILKNITEHRQHGYKIGEYELPSFNAVTEDVSEIIQQHKDVNGYNYKKYNLSKKEVVAKYNRNHERLLAAIDSFKALKEHAGDEIIVWSNQKVTIRLKKLGFDGGYWSINEYITAWTEHLKKKGVKVTAKMSNIVKAEVDLDNGVVQQEDLFKVFKRGSASSTKNAISKMDLVTLCELMDSDLKCVAERSKGHLQIIIAKVMEILEGGCKSIRFIKNLNKNPGDDKKIYSSIVSFLRRHKKLDLLTPDFFLSNSKHLNILDFKDFIISHGEKPITFQDSMFDKVLSKLPKEYQLSLHPTINEEVIKRMDVAGKIKALGNENIRFWTTDFEPLFASVPWSDLKKIIATSDRRKRFMNRMFVENDFEFLKEAMSTFKEKDLKYFKPFSYEDKKGILHKLNGSDVGSRYRLRYEDELTGIFSTQELEKFLAECLLDSDLESYTGEIVKALNKEKAQEIILKCERPKVPLSKTACLDLLQDNIEVALHVLEFNNLANSYSYSRSYHGSNDGSNDPSTEVRLFLREIKTRDFAEKIFGEDFLYGTFGNYLGHLLTEEEKTRRAEESNQFLRKNLEYLPDTYLAKYKDAAVYKEAVGNRVYTVNKSFACELDSRLADIAA